MSRIVASVLISMLVSTALAQAPGRVQTATRQVVIFTNLENQLMDAVSSGNMEGAKRLLSDDFAVWTPQPPGSSMGRDEWLKSAAAELGNASVRQMAVKQLDDHAIADFVQTDGKKAYFIVDVWQKTGGEWRLQQRYQAPVDAAAYGGRRPTGKD